ncbi:MAG TPA: hypothetical protein VMS17_22245, partial [Gemmataceae bacterium]|nr:hypothetical protein [Gemmataceae bacterium]
MLLQNEPGRPARLHVFVLLLAALGLLLRLYCYFCDPSIWFDEAALMLNVLDKSYSGLLGPLEYAANGPPLFLWLEKSLVGWLGDSSWTWRLPALAASCLSLILFVPVAWRVSAPEGAVWAVGLFAFSQRVLWHTVEVRPYTIDVLVAVGVMAAWLYTASWGPVKRLLLAAVLCPLLMCLSYPAVFVCSALALVLLLEIRNSRRAAVWLSYGVYLAGQALTLFWLLRGPVRFQNEGMRASGFEDAWIRQMPDWSTPAGAARWPFMALFEALRYDLHPTGGLLLICAVFGAGWVIRSRGRRLALLVFGPLAAVMAAACLHRYPCGQGRPILFLTPAACLAIGAAVPVLLRWCWDGFARSGQLLVWATPRNWGGRTAGVILASLALSPMLACLYCIAVPQPRPDGRGAAAYILSHRRCDDWVAIDSWDQLYFYRRFDPCWLCPTQRLLKGEEAQSRCWLTINTMMSNYEADEQALTGRQSWDICERKQFGPLIVLL